MRFLNISESVGTEISGTLGFRLLLDLKMDYCGGLATFPFEPNKD
jgi:hypothetical protein